jgi:dihydrofolate synthase / folylpolyglutamate synthase
MLPDSSIASPEYQSALRWLYGLSPNVRTAAQIVADHPRKLGRTRALLDRLGRPDDQFLSVLVAGTKGKGSIAAYSEAMLRSGGIRTGLVTSPHLMTWCERTRIEGQDVDPATAARLLNEVRTAVEQQDAERPELGQVTTFEAGLAFSLLAFAERGILVAVVECGVGGLHDATNVLEPVGVALGPISYDHTGTLGATLSAIAAEKTGIFRAGRLAVSAAQPAEALAVVERAADERGACLELVGRDWRWQPDDDQPGRGVFTIAGPRGRFAGLTTPLLGRHQRENATLAAALATRTLQRVGGTTANIDRAVRAGIADVDWPGRLQVIRERPWLVLDGAHNGDSAARLAEALGDCFGDRRRHLVFGTSVGKDVTRMMDALLPAVSTVTLTRSHHERSVSLDVLAQALAARGVTATTVPEVSEAVAQALVRAGADDVVIVTGSLFVVGEVLEGYGAAAGGDA